MKVKFVKIDEKAICPEYQTSGAAGFDFHIIDCIILKPGETKALRTGLMMEIPKGYELQVRPRGGTSLKTDLTIKNSPGTVDSDYRGEIMIIVANRGEGNIPLVSGDRIAQGVITPVVQVEFEEVEELESTDRGDGRFGHTGDN